MTVSTTKASDVFPGNGVTTGFPCEWRIFDETDVLVSLVDETSGDDTPLVLNTDYTISGAGDQAGFTVAVTGSPVPSGTSLYVRRALPYKQPTDFTNQGAFFPTMHEDAMDRLEMQIQQQVDELNRSLKSNAVTGNFDLEGKRVTNAGDASSGSDLPTYDQVSQMVTAAASGIVPSLIVKFSDLIASAGAALVGFIQAGVGAVVRTVQDKLRENVSVFDFGAVGDGTTDDTTAIQAAIDGSTGTVNLGDGYTFKVSQLTGRSHLRLVGDATLDFSGNASYASNFSDPLFKCFGSAGPAVAVTADIALGATTITVADTTGIAAGDIIEIATPGNNGGYVDTSVGVQNGESVMVLSVDSSTQLSLAEPVVDEGGYTVANNAQIRKLNTIDNITIDRGVKIIGKGRPTSGPGDFGLVFWYGRNIKVHCDFTRVDYNAVRFESCYNYEASGCTVLHDAKGTNGTVNYGIVPASSSNHGRVFNNIGHNMRHFMVTSHLSIALGLNTLGVVRNLDVYDNTAVNTWHAGFATHNDVDRIRIRGNTAIGCAYAVNARERNVEIIDNKGIRCQQVVYLSAQPRNILVRGNKGIDYTGALVYFDIASGVRDITDISIEGNEGERGVAGITVSLPTPISAHQRISIGRNKLRNCAGIGGLQAMIRVTGSAVTTLTIKDNEISDCTNTQGIGIANGGTKVMVLGNVVTDVSGNAFSTQGTYSLSYGRGNAGSNWSGSSNLTNGATITTDNTLNASL